MKKIVLVKTGDTFPEISKPLKDFEHWIVKGLEVPETQVRVVDVPRGETLPDKERCKAAVIAGSHAMVTEELGWSLAVEKWLPDLVENNIPVLGICYGHQLLAKAMGGRVEYHPGGIEIGTTRVKGHRTGFLDPLFKGLPEQFDVHVCHSQTVAVLPPSAVLLASNVFESHHAFRIGPHAWGVQFHPEYDETIMKAYIRSMTQQIEDSGLDAVQLLWAVRPTPVAAKILKRFGRLIA